MINRMKWRKVGPGLAACLVTLPLPEFSRVVNAFVDAAQGNTACRSGCCQKATFLESTLCSTMTRFAIAQVRSLFQPVMLDCTAFAMTIIVL